MSGNTRTLTIDQIDEITNIHTCLSSITELMIPSGDLNGVNRDNFSILLGYFTDRLRSLTDGSSRLNGCEFIRELGEIKKCLTVIVDLICPCDDLHLIDRDDFELLFSHFFDRLREITEGAV